MGDQDADEEYEILDLTKYDEKWVNKVFGDISKQSAAKQLVVGTGSGWVAGWLFVKVGKVAAASIGMSVLLIQIAQHQGYIKINWNQVERSMGQARRKLEKTARRHYPGMFSNVQAFFRQNIILAGGFAGGFLMGIAF
ncbi:FUN14 domain-containing protein 1 [Patella vulgata]|uniref:FUN14 domain-containing protein 1 n=1 Tax=Patella vulgata TaxID=6465 RepID=UPI00217F3656|nr:FUN14 domain-containing protein 1 [Patella vulgata]